MAQQYENKKIAEIILESAKQDNEDLPCPPINDDIMINSKYQRDLLQGIPFRN